jgi:hypothetical protein
LSAIPAFFNVGCETDFFSLRVLIALSTVHEKTGVGQPHLVMSFQFFAKRKGVFQPADNVLLGREKTLSRTVWQTDPCKTFSLAKQLTPAFF